MINVYKKRIDQLEDEYIVLCQKAGCCPSRFQYYTTRLIEVGSLIEHYKHMIREFTY